VITVLTLMPHCPATIGCREGSTGRAAGRHCLGILVSVRTFQPSELLLAIGAFLVLGVVALNRGSRLLAGACCCLGLFFAGALAAFAHAPTSAELDAEGREIVILGAAW